MKKFYTPIFLLFSLLFLQNCNLPEYHLQRHNYDAAFRTAAGRLGGKRQKTRHLRVFETAFAAANDRDLATISTLKSRNGRPAWEQIHFLHAQMRSRHERLRPLLPLASEEGYRPRMRTLPVEEWESESYSEVVKFYLQDIRAQLHLTTATEKMPAQHAFELLRQLEQRYAWNGLEAQSLADSCYFLGTTFILLGIENHRAGNDGQQVATWLHEWEIDLDRDWKELHRSPQPGLGYDLIAQLDIERTNVSGEHLSRTYRTVSEQVQVGAKEVKDTAGTVIGHEPIYETVCATITETTLTKTARIAAMLTVTDAHTGALVLEKMLEDSYCYFDSGCSYSGDSRAVDVIGCWFFPPRLSAPSDLELLRRAANSLQGSVCGALQRVGDRF